VAEAEREEPEELEERAVVKVQQAAVAAAERAVAEEAITTTRTGMR
jgi:hypothetical protein